MSVIATYARLNPDQLDVLRTAPDWLDHLYSGRLTDAEVLDIDKACDGIVWLLSRGSSAPAPPIEGGAFVLRRSLAPLVSGAGGKKEPQLKAPYGPATSLQPAQVVELSTWLESVDADELRRAYKPDAMADDDVYPQIWREDGEAALEEYLLPHLAKLKTFLSAAARAGQGVIVFFT